MKTLYRGLMAVICLVVLCLPAASAPLVNGDFSQGIDGLDGWNRTGLLSFGVGGGTAALRSPSTFIGTLLSAQASSIASNLDITVPVLEPLIFDNGPLRRGNAIYQDFDAFAGESISFQSLFLNEDGIHDIAFASLSQGFGSWQILDLYDVGGGSFMIQADGQYRIGFGVINTEDNLVASTLLVADVVQSVPEIDTSSAALPLLTLAFALLAVVDRRRKPVLQTASPT